MRPKTLQNLSPTFELDPVPLSIVKTDGFDPLETIQGPGETGGRILPARKEDQGASVPVHGRTSWSGHRADTVFAGEQTAGSKALKCIRCQRYIGRKADRLLCEDASDPG